MNHITNQPVKRSHHTSLRSHSTPPRLRPRHPSLHPRPNAQKRPLPKKSHVIPPGQFSTSSTNVAIPTMRFQCLKDLHGNHVRHCWGTMSAMPAMPVMRVLSTSARHLVTPHSTPPNAAPHPRNAAPRPTNTAPRLAHAPPHPRNAASRARTHKEPRPRPTGIGDEAGVSVAERRGSAYSLTAPAVRPDTMYFCRYWNSRTTGMAAITEPAAKMPHGAVRESAAHMYMPTASVNWL